MIFMYHIVRTGSWAAATVGELGRPWAWEPWVAAMAGASGWSRAVVGKAGEAWAGAGVNGLAGTGSLSSGIAGD